MSYTVKKIENTYQILEKESETCITLKGEEKKIREICRKLNLGSGFAGWTPTFFAQGN